MGSDSAANFIYLNRNNAWSGFGWEGLERSTDGALQLIALPVLDGDLPAPLAELAVPDNVLGIAVDQDGNVYLCCKDGRILSADACAGTSAPTCPSGAVIDLGKDAVLRGLCVVARRGALAVADNANACIRLVSMDSRELIDVWSGSRGRAGSRDPDSTLDAPTALASDGDGNVFVVDRDGERIQKFDLRGSAIPEFAAIVRGGGIRAVADIATAGSSIYVLHRLTDGKWSIAELRTDGRPVLDAHGKAVAFGAGDLRHPLGLAADAERVYVGDNAKRRILTYARRPDAQSGYVLAGEALGYEGPVAGLCLDHRGGLYVHAGSDAPPIRLLVTGGFRKDGVAWSREPIALGDQPVSWQRLTAYCAGLGPSAHLQLFYFASDDLGARPPRTVAAGSGPWRALPADLADGLLDVKPSRALWIAVHFRGGGRASVRLSQLRVAFDAPSYTQYLPSIYRVASGPMSFLDRYLRLLEALNDEVERRITQLPRLMDPAATDAGDLAWLGGWVGAEFDDDWDETKRRVVVSTALERSRARGSAEGLRRSLVLLADVQAVVAEPVVGASWWALAEEPGASADPGCGGCADGAIELSILGCSTFLPLAEPDGAVLGRTAVIDESDLIPGEDVASPLFDRLAYRATIFLHSSQVQTVGALAKVTRIIENEKPAHVAYEICMIEPRLRVGYQSTIGLDTVIGDATSPKSLHLGEALGEGRLAGEAPGRVEARSQVGVTTTLDQVRLG